MENREYIVAIDLGSDYVVVAVGSRAEDDKLKIEKIAIKKSAGVVKGEVKNVEQAAQAIKKTVTEVEKELGITLSEVYTGISGNHLKCVKQPYYVYVSSKDGEIFDQDVARLTRSMQGVQAPDGYKLLSIMAQHYLVNEREEVSDPVGMFGKTLGSVFNLIIGETNIVSRLEKALQKVEISQKKLFINPLATAEAVTYPDEKELGVAVVDLGAGTTDICIYQDGIVRYVGVIPMGAEVINRDIRAYGIMERYVEELKLKYGYAIADQMGDDLIKVPGRTPNDHKSISFKALASIIEARVLDIIDFVMEEIKEAGFEGKLGAGVVLTGGSAQLKEIGTLFESHTKLDVRIALPDVMIEEGSKELVGDTRFATVVGLLYLGMLSGEETITRASVKKEVQPEQEPIEEQELEEEGDEDEFLEDDDDGKRTRRGRKRREDRGAKRGVFGGIKSRLEKIFDFDVLDDDNTIV